MVRRSENAEESHAATEWLEIDSIDFDQSDDVGVDSAAGRM
jgi:hypothetical protein